MPPDGTTFERDKSVTREADSDHLCSEGNARAVLLSVPCPKRDLAAVAHRSTVEKGRITLEPRGDELLTPAGVAALLYVDPKTVTRWAIAGKLDSIRTPGGHRRFLRSDIEMILRGRRRELELVRIPEPRREDETLPERDPDVEATDVEPPVRTAADVFAAAAEGAAAAATRARRARAKAADQAAAAVAREAVRTARRVQIRADVAAAQVEQAAALALERLQPDGHPGGSAAVLMADTVEAAAQATAEDTAIAARVVASAVTAAAAQVARMVLASDEAFALEVARAAESLQDLTILTAGPAANAKGQDPGGS